LDKPLAARNSGTLQDFPYTVDKAMHFSNGGGIYRGTDQRTGGRVLLREARPLAGVDANGDDAVTRLQREREVLQRLDGLPCVPRLIDYRIGHEHYFLVREYVDGDSLMVEVNRRHPLCGEGPADGVAEYTQWALKILDQIDRGITQLHERGVIFGDLHPGNVMVRSDDSVCFIDFETASTDAQARQFQAAPGFVVPSHYQGPAVDRYMLACLRIALFVPLSGMLPWAPEKSEELIGFIRSHFPVPTISGPGSTPTWEPFPRRRRRHGPSCPPRPPRSSRSPTASSRQRRPNAVIGSSPEMRPSSSPPRGGSRSRTGRRASCGPSTRSVSPSPRTTSPGWSPRHDD
jgi:serine/threonine protein kinase